MSDEKLVTNTSQWALVVQRVTSTEAEVWVGTLFPFMSMPHQSRVILEDDAGVRYEEQILRDQWQRPFRHMHQRFYALIRFSGLQAGRNYRAFFERRVEPLVGVREQPEWQLLRDGEFRTLPNALPSATEKPFTVALASCFYNHRDGGQAAASYKALYERGGAASPDITFLSGDQVYLDIGFDSLSLIPSEIRERIASDYALHWQALGSIFTRGGTWMLPDDHEYWNDYPFYDSLIPTLLALKLPHVRRAWKRASEDAVQNIQCSAVVETFSIGDELSFCIADLRSFRKGKKMLPDADFERLCHWAKNLNGPGVLLLPQPLIVEKNSMERNLRSFPKQYAALLEALGSSGHDVVIMSGDVHFGRIAETRLGQGGRLIEVISSPLSNLTGLNGVATAAPTFQPQYFPDSGSARTLGWTPAEVEYRPDWHAVSVKPGFLLSAYPRPRTREHFMTVGFQRDGLGGIRLTAQAWRVRERQGDDNLPVQDFARPFVTQLR